MLAEDWSVFVGRVRSLDEVAHHGAEIGTLRDLYLHGYAGNSAAGPTA